MGRIAFGFVVLFALNVCFGQSTQSAVTPLLHAHAHNDYEHEHPLFDALANGYCSVEADVHLINGQLHVAHDKYRAMLAPTLEKLYLEPLAKRARENGGRIYRDGPASIYLLIDIKTEAEATYAKVREVLMRYPELITTFDDGGKMNRRAVTVIMTGGRARKTMEGEKVHYAAYDGKIGEDVNSDASTAFMPWLSGDWKASFKWDGEGAMPESEKKKLGDLVAKAHARLRLLRLWGAPDNVATWIELRSAGVDLINTDDLAGCREFLLSSKSP